MIYILQYSDFITTTKSISLELNLFCSQTTAKSAKPNLQGSSSSVLLASNTKVSSYIAQNPILRTAQSTFLGIIQPSATINARMSIARYSYIQLSELEQCRMIKHPQDFTLQHKIRTRVLLIESPKLYP